MEDRESTGTGQINLTLFWRMTMMQKQTETKKAPLGKQKNYTEVIEFLDKHWHEKRSTLEQMKKLDKALGSLSKKVDTILVSGTNGKSLTIGYVAQLLKDEKLSVGTFSAPHILTYNERLGINGESVSNKLFTELANEVIHAAETAGISAHTQEILTAMALLHWSKSKVDVGVLEVNNGSAWDPTKICSPKITALTRVTQKEDGHKSIEDTIKGMLDIVQKDTWFISADQSKLNLQVMLDYIQDKGAQWAMPIRKLVPLAYPFEQLHGRCAALAERIASIYVNSFVKKDAKIIEDSLLLKKKGQRGRPTLEAKRQAELHPKRTIEHFWKEVSPSLPGRFQIFDKEKPTLLLDNASNIDAFENLLLGIRLLHYQRPLKGLAVVVGSDAHYLDTPEFAKLIRYFFKKTSGHIIFCPVNPTIPGYQPAKALDVDKAANEAKNVKVKAKAAKNFKDAFESACKTVDERHGLVVITGSDAILSEYWRYKGIKKI